MAALAYLPEQLLRIRIRFASLTLYNRSVQYVDVGDAGEPMNFTSQPLSRICIDGDLWSSSHRVGSALNGSSVVGECSTMSVATPRCLCGLFGLAGCRGDDG